MAASLQKVQATAPFMNTSRGVQGHEGDDKIQSLEHKLGASDVIGGVGQSAQVHHFTQKGMAVYALSGVIKNYARALEGTTGSSVNVGGARRSHCDCFRP